MVSVRSGAAISMPGMMDTILNLGLNDQTVTGLSEKSNNPRFSWDSYRRFIQLFGKVVFVLVALSDQRKNRINQRTMKVLFSAALHSNTSITVGVF